MPDSKAVLYGLTPSNYTEADITRATVEGVTLGLNYGLNRIRELGTDPKEIRLTGGASRNKTWAQMCADIFDTPVVRFRESEGAALGAAIQALWCHEHQDGADEEIGELTNRLVVVDESTRLKPHKDNAETYRKIQRRHDKLRDNIFREN